MSKKPAGQDKRVTTIDVNDPDSSKGALKTVGGSRSDHWNNNLLNQAANTLWIKNSDEKTCETQCKATMSALVGIAPKDEIEGMIAAQLIAAHNAAMECYRRAMHSEQTFEGRRENLNQANKLSRSYAVLVEALNRHRGKGQQKVTVEHVHVHSGGQAVVGVVEPSGGEQSIEIRGSTCQANYPCTSARDAEREPGAGSRASHQRCRTADVGCTEASHQEPRRGIKTPSNMGAIRRKACCAAELLHRFCGP
jgi:hypothetical protein